MQWMQCKDNRPRSADDDDDRSIPFQSWTFIIRPFNACIEYSFSLNGIVKLGTFVIRSSSHRYIDMNN